MAGEGELDEPLPRAGVGGVAVAVAPPPLHVRPTTPARPSSTL